MKLSVVISTFQRRAHLSELLESLAVSIPPERRDEIEIVVIVDGSTDGSTELLETLAPDYPVELRYVWQENAGIAATRNHGARLARGELVWFIDDDLRVTPGAVTAHLEHRRDVAPVAMGACVIRADGPLASTAASWYDERWNRLADSPRITDPVDLGFANTSLPAEIARTHAFDERFRGYGPEDCELAIRMLRAGVLAEYVPAASLAHDYTPSVDERLRKLRQEGVNRCLLCEIHPEAAEMMAGEKGRFERLVSKFANGRWSATTLWGLARAISLVGRAPLPFLPRAHIQRLAEVAALHSGIAGRRAATT